MQKTNPGLCPSLFALSSSELRVDASVAKTTEKGRCLGMTCSTFSKNSSCTN